MTTQISGTTGVSQVQDGTVTSAKIVDGTIAKADLAADAKSIGVGQTWQDVSGSRTSGTTYTNSTSQPIMVSYMCSVSAGSFSATVGGVLVASSQSSTGAFIATFIVPAGATYVITESTIVRNGWKELR